ncbi:MAG: dialkylresorcinol condensing enzyme [Neisseria sp.]|nr:dialkylresorcinol condensing enzyme [Neisseria sp.]
MNSKQPHTPRVLIVYYSQTGQLARMAEAFAAPLRQSGAAVEMLPLRPQRPYPFPWPFWRFFNTFPETVHLQPAPIETPQFAHAHYDLVVIAYTVWFLSPSQPVTAFLQHPAAREILRGTRVMTLIGCRNMWLMAQEKMKTLLADAGAVLTDNVVKIDACSSAWSFVTTPLWLLTGKQQGAAWMPRAGIAEAEIADCARFGARVGECLAGPSESARPMLRGMGAVRVNERLVFSETAAARSFYLWGKLLLAAGRVSPLLRRGVLALYIVFLIAIILTLVPLSALLKRLFAPLLADKIRRQKAYFSEPSGE